MIAIFAERVLTREARLEVALEVAVRTFNALQLFNETLHLLFRRVGACRLRLNARHIGRLAHGEAEAGNLRRPVNLIRAFAREVSSITVVIPNLFATIHDFHARIVEV